MTGLMVFIFGNITWTYSSQLHVCRDAVLPGEAEDVGQVEGKVDDAAASGRQVGLVKKHAHQETLHDGGNGERQQKEEDENGVAVIQHLPTLKRTRHSVVGGFSLTRPVVWRRERLLPLI